MLKIKWVIMTIVTVWATLLSAQHSLRLAGRIDREVLVKRHTVQLDKLSNSELLQVGNGEIAFGIDATGLQTFYGNTMSHWGWHSVSCPVESGYAVLKLEEFDFHGRILPYRSSSEE